MDLKAVIKKKGFVAKQLRDSELTELTCRVQIGTPIGDILGELQGAVGLLPKDHVVTRNIGRHADSYRTPDVTFILASLQDKEDDVRRVYEFYDELCAEEFERIPQAFKETWVKMGGLPYYRSERTRLFAGGVPDVPEFLGHHIRLKYKFLGEVVVGGGAKQELINALDGAQKWLENVPLIGQQLKRHVIASIPSRSIIGWSPRSIIRKEYSSMGPHHVGLAVDINASTNPHLIGASATTIDAVLDHLTSKKKFPEAPRLGKPFIDLGRIDREPDRAVELAVEMWGKSMSISNAFQAFLNECLDKQKNKQPLDPDVQVLFDRCAKTFPNKLKTLAIQGVFNLNVALIAALVSNGLMYGGEFKEDKDQHHFQVRPRNWPFKAPECLEQWNKTKAAGRRKK